MSMIKEFQKFINRGSVVDLAVGVIIGAAFGKIVSSFVNDIMMPILGFFTGKVDFSQKVLTILKPNPEEGIAGIMIGYGNFLQVTIEFLIVAFAVFLLVKGVNKLREITEKKEAETPKSEPVPTKEEVLLGEIRDLLKDKK